MSRYRRFTLGAAIASVGSLACIALLYGAGARVNTTPSIPVGLYWRTSAPIERGAYIMFCAPVGDSLRQVKDRGYIGSGSCPGRLGYLMKKVLAAKKDRISIGRAGVQVNGALLPASAPLVADVAGRPLGHFATENHELGSEEVLPMSDGNPYSYDGRYFGPVTFSQIEAVISPVITW